MLGDRSWGQLSVRFDHRKGLDAVQESVVIRHEPLNVRPGDTYGVETGDHADHVVVPLRARQLERGAVVLDRNANNFLRHREIDLMLAVDVADAPFVGGVVVLFKCHWWSCLSERNVVIRYSRHLRYAPFYPAQSRVTGRETETPPGWIK